MTRSIPLRYALPFGFLALSTVLMALAYGLRHAEIVERNETLMRQRAAGLGAFVVPELEEEFARGAANAGDPLFGRLHSIPHLKSAFVCDESGLILNAMLAEWRGRRYAEVAAGPAALLARDPGDRTVRFGYLEDRGRLWAAFPLSLGATSAGPARLGWFCTESDVAAQMAPVIAAHHRGTVLIAGVILITCAGLWYYFDRTVTRRATALVAATRAISAGRLETRAAVTGADEFAQLGAAFNQMADELKAREATARGIERRATDAIEASGLGTWAWNIATGDCADNLGWERILGYGPGEIGPHLSAWQALIHPEDLPAVLVAFAAHRESRTRRYSVEYRMRNKAGQWTWVRDVGEVTERDAAGGAVRIVGTSRDITGHKAAESLLAGQRDLFEHIASGQPLATSLEAICRFAEASAGGWLCSILVLERDGRRLRHGAAPSLPAEYCRAIDGMEIGPSVGSCGTAAFRREPVIVTDIATDPLWADYRGLAAAHGLRACWSTPIMGDTGKVLGTLGMYAREPRQLEPAHEAMMRLATHAASIALQRERADELLRRSEDRFEKAFRASPAAIFISKLNDGRLVDVNQAFLDLFGYQRRDEVIGRTSLELNMWADPADRQRVVAALAKKSTLTYIECALLRPTGERRDALASVEVIELEGEPCMLALAFDVTDRKQAEAALRKSEIEIEQHRVLLEASLDSLSEGVVVCDMEGNVFYWNRAALQLHGYASMEECRRRLPEFTDLFEFIRPDGSILPFEQWPLVRVLRGEVVRDVELRLRHKHAGWDRLFVYSGSLARDAAGQPLLAVLSITDITGRRQIEDQLRQSQKMDAIGQLAGGVAHDFNNILTAVILRAELAGLHPEVSADSRETLAEIGRLGHRAARLTRQLLAFSRKSIMQREDLNLSDVVAADATMLRRMVGENIRLELRLLPQPLPVFADEGMIGQVLLNLAINARDAMPRGGRLRIETSERLVTADEPRPDPAIAPGRYACVRVTDSGTGIAPEHLPKIFEPFFTTKAVGQGTGLGLATVFGIVRQHDGWIAVESPPGEGATFLVFLPLEVPLKTATETETPDLAPPARGTETILLVEDEEPVRRIFGLLLSGQGYTVFEAEHGPAALAIWQREKSKIDLLLTDLVMPEGMTGQELAARLQGESPTLKVIFTTGYSAEFAGRDLDLHARQNLLQKPYATTVLLATVRRVLDSP